VIEAAICTLLEQDAAVSALIGDRLTEMPLPQGSALPALTYQVIGPWIGSPALDGPNDDDLGTVRVQVDCWAETSGTAASLAAAVLGKLHGYSGIVDGVRVPGVFLAGGGGREYEDETRLRRVRMDFRIHCRKGDA
jgi:hypothetical protein